MEGNEPVKKIREKPKGPGILDRLKNTVTRYRRVLSVARKPDNEEYVSTLKITGAMLLIVGSIGFIIFLLYYLLRMVLL